MLRYLAFALVAASLGTTPAAGQAQPINWDRDLQRAWQSAQSQQRPLILFVTSEQCHYCVLMKQQTWRDPAVVSAVRQGFVAAEVSTNFNDRIAQLLNIRVLPTTLVISTEQKVLARFDGYMRPDQLVKQLEELPQQLVSTDRDDDQTDTND